MVRVPEFLRDKVARAPESSYGVVKVTVILKDGRKFTDVEISWDYQILKCRGLSEIPFKEEDVADIR